MVHKTIHRKQKISNMNPLIKLGGDVNQTLRAVTFKTIEDKNKKHKQQGQRKAWRIPSPKN